MPGGYYSKEIFSEYLEKCKFALTLDENEGEIHRLLAGCYFPLGDFALGQYHIDRAMLLSPNDSLIIARASRLYILLGDDDKAKDLIDRAMRLNPLHPGWYWVHLGMVYYFREDCQSAIECMRKNTEPSGYDLRPAPDWKMHHRH